MEISARLIERFGGQIHPQPENGDQEQRIGNISWLIMRISQLVRQIPITESKLGHFNLNDYESARMLQAQLQRDPDSVTDDRVTLDKFSAAAGKTDRNKYTQWLADAGKCRAALEELIRVADSLFGPQGPSFGPLAESLDAIHDRLQRIARELGLMAEPEMTTEQGGADDAAASEPEQGAVRSTGPIKTRAQALEQLRLVADFFRRTEPHSPVAYLAEKAAHWGNMPLHLWLRSVLKDQGSLAHLEELLGTEADAGRD